MIARLLISPSPELIKQEITKALASLHINHPDVLYFSPEAKLGIAEARKIKVHFSLKPYSGKGRVVVLENASALTPEAQNALLKTLEELPKDALFLLGANSDANFLPTILSRCQITYLNKPSTSDVDNLEYLGIQKDIEKLLNSNLEERFTYIEKLKDRAGFLKALTVYFHQNISSNSAFLKELLKAEEWANQNVNMRAILEYLMLVMHK